MGKFSLATKEREDGTRVILLAGECDVYTSPRVKQEVVDLLQANVPKVEVDLTDVTYLDSTGLGVLIGSTKRATERGIPFELVCANPRIIAIFDQTGLSKVLPNNWYRREKTPDACCARA